MKPNDLSGATGDGSNPMESTQQSQLNAAEPNSESAAAGVVIATRDDAKTSRSAVQEMAGELQRVKAALKKMEDLQLPEAERYKRDLETANAERDQAHQQLQEFQRRDAVEALARTQSFNDPEYLDFLLRKHRIDPMDHDACEAYLKTFATAHPRYFNIAVHPGAEGRDGHAQAAPHENPQSVAHARGRTDFLTEMLAQAPTLD